MTDEQESSNLPVPVGEAAGLVAASDEYLMTRARIFDVCERLAKGTPGGPPSPRHTALSYVERWERSLNAAVLAAAPDAETAKRWFEIGARAFLESP